MKLNSYKIIMAFLICGAVSMLSSAIPAFAATAGSQQKSVAQFDDYTAIRNVIGLYIQAGKEAKSEIVKPAFHKDAIIYGSDGSKVTGGPIQELFDYIDKNPKATGLEAEITMIEIATNIASVRVESNNWHGARYSDLFLLLKGEDGWKIITKTYYTHK